MLRSSSRPGHFIPGELTTITNQVGSCGLRSWSGSYAEENNSLPFWERNHISSVAEPVSSQVATPNMQFQFRSRDVLHRCDPEFNSLNDVQCTSKICTNGHKPHGIYLISKNAFRFITKPLSGGLSHVEQTYMNYSLRIRHAMKLVLYRNR
jgi:hypothetical protein